MSGAYHYIRFTWWITVDMKEVATKLGESFDVQSITMPYDEGELSLYKEVRDKLKVTADTLEAILSPIRAILFQREPAPFTARDLELRKRIIELYPRDRSTPFPMFFSKEPEFEVAG